MFWIDHQIRLSQRIFNLINSGNLNRSQRAVVAIDKSSFSLRIVFGQFKFHRSGDKQTHIRLCMVTNGEMVRIQLSKDRLCVTVT